MGHLFGLVLRAYACVIAVGVIIAELGVKRFFLILAFMEGFVGRGLICLL
jgi:hypothetical protein